VRRLAVVLAGVVLVLGGAAGLQLALSSRDDADIGNTPGTGPGELQRDLGSRHLQAGQHIPLEGLTDPPTSGAHHPRLPPRDRTVLSPDQILHALELGDVVILYDAPDPGSALTRLQAEVAGAFDAELAAGGQAVVLARRAGAGPATALAWRRSLPAVDSADPRLRAFADAWLGRGA
jgi:hypothetical protein